MGYGHTYVKVSRRVWYAPWIQVIKWRCGNCGRTVKDEGGYPSP